MAYSASGKQVQSEFLSGRELYRLLGSGLVRLESAVDAINEINVFPVPDRDTGTNMFDTLRHTLASAEPADADSLRSVAERISERALYGARGNSGVLLAEFLRGFAGELAAGERTNSRRLVRAFRRGALAARAAVGSVVEGTILTVMNDAARGAEQAGERVDDITGVLLAASVAARESLESTPRLLPVLRRSRVVDAGAAGFVVILDGMVLALGGEVAPLDVRGFASTAPADPSTAPEGGTGIERAAPPPPAAYGYCTELLVRSQAAGLDEKGLIERISPFGDSLLVIGTKRVLRVHIHASDPGAVISECLRHGSIEEVAIRNMDAQAASSREEPEAQREQVGVVAVADGKGFAEIFRSLGAEVVEIVDHDTRRAEEELRERVDALPHGSIIVLPNHRQALGGLGGIVDWKGKAVRSIETTTMPEGIAALVELDPASPLEENLRRMASAAAEVHTVAIDREEGQYLLALGDRPLGRSNDLSRLVRAVIDSLPGGFELATVYYSAAAEREQVDEIAAVVRENVARVELHLGGQDAPLYLVSLE